MRPHVTLHRTALISHRICILNTRNKIPCRAMKQFSTTNARQFGPSPHPPSITLAASLVLGLPAALWAYKCLLMVLLQRKLVYMGYAPPGARGEESSTYTGLLRGTELEEIRLKNVDHNVTLHGIVMRNSEPQLQLPKQPRIALIYLQGNAGNPLHRIPMFNVLLHACCDLDPVVLAVAPRSFWKSTRRTPTEAGLLNDYRQVVEYAHTRWPESTLFLYGHSLGASVGACLASKLDDVNNQEIRGLVLENPFSSIPDMVRALYTSRWLPYHYLGRFVWDKWDAVEATREAPSTSVLGKLLQENRLLVLQSEKDELVPLWMGNDICKAGKTRSPLVIRGALHENAWESREWGIAIRQFLQEMLKLQQT